MSADIDLDIKVEDGPAAEEDTGDVDDAPVVRYIQKILLDAINSSVSDIHFEPYESSTVSDIVSTVCWWKSPNRHW